MSYVPRSINVQDEEREEYLDVFSTCDTFLREELSLTNQLFDDLGRSCPNNLATCEPLQMGRLQEEGANALFLSLLRGLGIDAPQELSRATGVELTTCADVMANPIKSNGVERARIMEALEQPPVCAWDVIDPLTGKTIGEQLAIWQREYFLTPWQFKRQAAECELKCFLIGAVSSLHDADIESLLSAPQIIGTLETAASAARACRAKDIQAASAIDSAIKSLAAAKETVEEAAACVVPKAHN